MNRDDILFRIDKFYSDPKKEQRVVSLGPGCIIAVVRDTAVLDQIREGILQREPKGVLILYVSYRIRDVEINLDYIVNTLKGLAIRKLRREGLDPDTHFVDISHVNLKQLSNTEFLTLPRVMNKRYNEPTGNTVYIGRPSKYGNPYSHLGKEDEEGKVGTREEAVSMYENHFLNLPEAEQEDIKRDLKGKDLMCWCVGGKKLVPCHGHALLQLCN